MPKTIMVTNVVLLLCLSVLAGSVVTPHLGGDVVIGHDALMIMTVVGTACGAVMLVSEMFSGIRWAPVVALASLIGGWLAGPPVREVAWLLGWLAVAAWFAYLAAQARENR